MRIFFSLTLLLIFSSQAFGHNLWMERKGPDSVHVYFGHPEDNLFEETGGRLDIIKANVLLPQGKLVSRQRLTDSIELTVSTSEDVALVEEMKPRKSRNSDDVVKMTFLARSGRTETKALTKLDMIPRTTGGNTFVVTMDGKVLADQEVSLLMPDNTAITHTTDREGKITLVTDKPGEYLATMTVYEEKPGELNGVPYAKLGYSYSLHFIVK